MYVLALRSQRASDLLGLELHIVVAAMRVVGIKPRSSIRVGSALNH